jgi:two-component system nitrate/nitrite response regulator NarL
MDPVLRVFIADDHPLFRLGLKFALQGQGFEVVGEAESGSQALAVCSSTQPDVAILDVKMPDGDGIQICQQLLAQSGSLVVILLTTFQEPALIQAARQAGAKGYLSKDAADTLISHTIRQIIQDPSRDWLPIVEEIPHLTPRELAVLKLMMQGLANKQIARKLGLSIETIKEYASSAYRKLDTNDRVSALFRAQELGILSPEKDPSA